MDEFCSNCGAFSDHSKGYCPDCGREVLEKPRDSIKIHIIIVLFWVVVLLICGAVLAVLVCEGIKNFLK